MICPSCRAENIEGEDICANCGHDLAGADLPDSPSERPPDFIYDNLAALPSSPPAVVGPSDPVGLAVKLMQNQGAECVLVMEGDVLAGIITPWDILHKVAGPSEDLNAVTCARIMTKDPVCLRESDNVAVALNKMAVGEFRHIPLIHGARVDAVVGVEAIFHHISPHLV